MEGPAYFLVGGGTSLPSLYTSYIWNGHLSPSFPNNICRRKARQVVRVDWSWMDFLSLSMLLSLPLSVPPFFFLFYKAQRLVFHWLQSPSIWMVVCVLSEQRGRAASEEVLDRRMDWAQRLGWVEVQVQASLAEPWQLREGLHSNCCGTFRDWEKWTCVPQLHSTATYCWTKIVRELREFYSGLTDLLYCPELVASLLKPGLGLKAFNVHVACSSF